MTSNYDYLGVSPSATPAEIKAAYHAKLREFPAHTYPDEFKAIRAAYEVLRQGGKNQHEDFLKVRPLELKLDPEILQRIQEKAIAQLSVSLEEMIRFTF